MLDIIESVARANLSGIYIPMAAPRDKVEKLLRLSGTLSLNMTNIKPLNFALL